MPVYGPCGAQPTALPGEASAGAKHVSPRIRLQPAAPSRRHQLPLTLAIQLAFDTARWTPNLGGTNTKSGIGASLL
jgi:hypothetical protein